MVNDFSVFFVRVATISYDFFKGLDVPAVKPSEVFCVRRRYFEGASQLLQRCHEIVIPRIFR